MQTFLPYPSFEKSAACLDYRRLGKQRVEAMQLLKALSDPSYSWGKHPAAKMWKGHYGALAYYMNTCIHEWVNRGYKNTMKLVHTPEHFGGHLVMPNWIGNEAFHLSHQSNLVRKFPEHYRKYFPEVPDNLPYIWPE